MWCRKTNLFYVNPKKMGESKATRNIAFTQYEVKTLFYDGALYELDTMEIWINTRILIEKTKKSAII